jgi:hypothetical protein
MNMGELDQIAPALVAALGALEDPVKDGKVAAGQRRYTYLTLPHLLAAVRPVLAAHGLCVLQDVEMSSEGVGDHGPGARVGSGDVFLPAGRCPGVAGPAVGGECGDVHAPLLVVRAAGAGGVR